MQIFSMLSLSHECFFLFFRDEISVWCFECVISRDMPLVNNGEHITHAAFCCSLVRFSAGHVALP